MNNTTKISGKKMELYKGIFWYINDHLLCRKVRCDSAGNPLESVDFTSKSGDNFNHKAEWQNMSKKITGGKPYNYYPRGRVEIKRNKATVYLNPVLNQEEIIAKILLEFDLGNLTDITVKSDGSEHYKALAERD